MKTWKLVLEYDGGKFSGWQEQPNARTVMGDLRKAAQTLFASAIDIQGAGRTDAGVHAEAQVAHLRATPRRPVTTQQLLRALNDELPAEIVVLSAEEAPPSFHARHDAATRTYRYQISRRKQAFAKKYVWWIKDPLDVARMAEAARYIPGRHNFSLFRQKDPTKPDDSPIVHVESASIEVPPEHHGHLIFFHVEASHFLWKMVRRLTGALVKIGTGELTPGEFAAMLDGRAEKHYPVSEWTAPSSGLFFESVKYKDKPAAHGKRHVSLRPKKR
jgi:tRNA pseudouridine38-40 synthase